MVDQTATSHSLGSALRTFAVVPVSPVIGLLAFVPDTMPVLGAMQALGRLPAEVVEGPLANKFAQGLKQVAKMKDREDGYTKVFVVWKELRGPALSPPCTSHSPPHSPALFLCSVLSILPSLRPQPSAPSPCLTSPLVHS